MRGREVVQRHALSVVGRVPALHQQGPVLEGPHGVDPGLHGGVDEAAVDPGGDFILLLPWSVWRLTCAGVVLAPVERHRRLPATFSIERVVAPGGNNSVISRTSSGRRSYFEMGILVTSIGQDCISLAIRISEVTT